MIKMTYNEYDKIEEKLEKLPDIVELEGNIPLTDMEALFIGTPVNQDESTGYSKNVAEYLMYLSAKISEMPNKQDFEQTSKNINRMLNKYLELTD